MTTGISAVPQAHYGCHNAPRASGYFAPDRLYQGNRYIERTTWIDDTASKDCRYDQKQSDKRCEGCGK